MFIGFIYQITNTVNGKVYIGKTCHPFDARWKQHCEQARNRRGHYIHNAIRKHGVENFRFDILDVAFTEEALACKEREYISRELAADRKFGYNLTLGGEGCRANEATRQKILQAHARPEEKLRKSRASKAALADPEKRKRRLKILREITASPEVKQKMAAARKAMWSDPTFRARRSASSRAANARPEVRQRAAETRLRPDVQERCSNAMKAVWADPTFRAKMLDMRSTPEARHQLLQAMASPEYKLRKSAGIKASHSNPEVRQRISDGHRASWANPESRERRIDAQRRSEVRKAKSDAIKAMWADPTYRENMLRVRREAWEVRKAAALPKSVPASQQQTA
jgi:group I intron endonuclease